MNPGCRPLIRAVLTATVIASAPMPAPGAAGGVGASGGPRSYPRSYTDRVQLPVLRGGEAPQGGWAEESVDVLADYRRRFGVEPPRRARLAILTDSDNTGQSTRAAIDHVQVCRQ